MGLKIGPSRKQIKTFEMRCYRKVLNISWQDKIRNDEVLARISRVSSPARNIISRIKDAQLSWFGHVDGQQQTSQANHARNGQWKEQERQTQKAL